MLIRRFVHLMSKSYINIQMFQVNKTRLDPTMGLEVASSRCPSNGLVTSNPKRSHNLQSPADHADGLCRHSRKFERYRACRSADQSISYR